MIGVIIKELRSEHGLSQKELGKILSVSQDTISLWERGKSKPDVDTIITIAKYFNVSSDYIFGIAQ